MHGTSFLLIHQFIADIIVPLFQTICTSTIKSSITLSMSFRVVIIMIIVLSLLTMAAVLLLLVVVVVTSTTC